MSLILDGTNGLSDVDGSASTPAIRGTDTNTGIFFPAADTIAFAEGGAEVARFDSSGNLGIAVTSPAAKLDVLGDIFARASTLRFKNSTNTTQYGAIYGDSTTFNINGGVDNLIMYSAGTERMRIDSSGNLLVGTTSSTHDTITNGMAVVGTGAITAVGIGHVTGSGSGTNYMSFNYAGTKIGSITQNGTTAVAYNTTSDYRLKDNVAPLQGALARVQALKPVTYTWKSAPDEIGEGFIAHELAEVFPQAVNGEKDAVETYFDEAGVEQTRPKYQGIDTSFLVATLTAAIQEQQTIITDLKSRIETLEAK